MNIAVLGAGVMGRLTERVARPSRGLASRAWWSRLKAAGLKISDKKRTLLSIFPIPTTPTRFADFARNVASRRS